MTVALLIRGNHFTDGAGHTIQLRGSTLPEPVRQCTSSGTFAGDSPFNAPGPERTAAIAAYQAWGCNVMRLQLNELCYLGANGFPLAPLSATQYQQDLHALTDELLAAGLRVILCLANGAPTSAGTVTTLGENMADAEHALSFWTAMANEYRNRPGVIFELYNEPNDIDYPVLRDGGTAVNKFWGAYQVAGYQQLLNAVRATGARNPVLVGGPHDSGNPTQWLQYMPHDPAGQLGCALHVYMKNQWLGLAAGDAGRDLYLRPILASKHPVVFTECGESTCADTFISAEMAWCDRRAVSYLPFSYNCGPGWDCTSPTLISDWAGTPSSAYGQAVRDHFLARA